MIGLTVRTVRLNHMPVMPVLTRLGYREGRSDPEAVQGKYGPGLERFMNETQVRLFYREVGLTATNQGIDLDGYAIPSRLLAGRFQTSRAALLSAASVLVEDYNQLLALTEANRLQEAVLLDAVLSEKVDYGLEFIQQELEAEYRRVGLHFGQRLSAGYGDFELRHQRYFYETLGLADHGIRLSPQFILFPEKTVTGLTPMLA